MGRRVSSVPSLGDITRPILEYANKRKEVHRKEAIEVMVSYFNLTLAQRNERTKKGNNRLGSRVDWAIYSMVEAGLLRGTEKGHYEITALGQQEVVSSKEKITLGYLQKKYPAYRH